MKATGAKLIKIAEFFGRDVFGDTETNAILIDIDDELIQAKSLIHAYGIAEQNYPVDKSKGAKLDESGLNKFNSRS